MRHSPAGRKLRFMTEKEISVHSVPAKQDKAPPAYDRGTNEQAPRDARDVINNHRKHKGDGATYGYHPRRGGRDDSGEDGSPSPEPPGPRVFSKTIRRTPFPNRFRQSTNLDKYSRESNPELWLVDYRLACQLGGAKDDQLIIQNLPLFLSDTA